jgi:hypothetical protein
MANVGILDGRDGLCLLLSFGSLFQATTVHSTRPNAKQWQFFSHLLPS